MSILLGLVVIQITWFLLRKSMIGRIMFTIYKIIYELLKIEYNSLNSVYKFIKKQRLKTIKKHKNYHQQTKKVVNGNSKVIYIKNHRRK